MVQLNTPPMLRGSGQEQLTQMRSYLYRLAEQLNGALNAIEADSLTEEAKDTLGSGAASEAAKQVREDMGKTSSVLKDLIIKTAESVRSETQRVERELRSSYVAKSEFGAYQEQVDAKFTATAENVTQSIRYASELEGRLDEQAGDLQGLISYRTETKGYIRQGIVGYEDTVPIIGIAIGTLIAAVAAARREILTRIAAALCGIAGQPNAVRRGRACRRFGKPGGCGSSCRRRQIARCRQIEHAVDTHTLCARQ